MSSTPTMATRPVDDDADPRRRLTTQHGDGRSRPSTGAAPHDPPGHHPRVDRAVVAGAIYHELRSTLGLISGYSESLLHLELDEATRRRYLERLASAAASLSEIADQLLDLAAADPRRPIVRRQPVSLVWLAERLAADAAAEVPGSVVHLDVDPALPLVDADPIWLGLVLRNLLRNALTHGRGRAAEARLRIARASDTVLVEVADDGPGFHPAERDFAFGLFFRGHEARSSGREGLGLGLYLCRALIEAHGGSIWIENVGPGATVAFSIPVGRPTVAAAEQRRAARSTGAGDAARRLRPELRPV